MQPSITIMSRARAIDESKHLECPTALISISDRGGAYPDFESSPWIDDVLYLFFDDVESAASGGMTYDDAQEILAFAASYVGCDMDIIVHCSAGRSRSAGTAAALMLLFSGDDSSVFDSPRYSPNMHCYRTVVDAARIGYDDSELDSDEAERTRVWRELAIENGLA